MRPGINQKNTPRMKPYRPTEFDESDWIERLEKFKSLMSQWSAPSIYVLRMSSERSTARSCTLSANGIGRSQSVPAATSHPVQETGKNGER
jgi:hypothetical protein